MSAKTAFAIAISLAANFAYAQMVSTQEPPSGKPIRIVVPFGAGGSSDSIARIIGKALETSAKRPVVVENKAGASGMIGAASCKAAAPDGSTLCLFLADIVTIHPWVFKRLPYDAEKDFVPVAFLGDPEIGIMVPSSHPARSLAELVAHSKANPGKVNWASYGVGTASHLMLDKINRTFNAGITHVPYKSVPEINAALLSNQVDVSYMGWGNYAQFVQAGKMRTIAVVGSKRARSMPDVPTLAEQGVDFRPIPWFGFFAPAGTPPAIVERFNKQVNEALADPVVLKQVTDQGYFPQSLSPAAFADMVRRDRVVWGEVAKGLNLNLE